MHKAPNVLRYFKTVFKILIFFFFLGILSNCTDSNNSGETFSGGEVSKEKDAILDENECKFKDGIHSAIVEYHNFKTGYSKEYKLEVEVENCEVVKINFPNGGWLDSDHITPEELDGNGSCTVEGEGGKNYKIQIDD